MILNKNNIKPEDRDLALQIRNHLINGQMVIGNPGLGLKKTLIELENKRDSRVFGKSEWVMKDAELEARVAMTKAGIEGEERLCEYLSRVLKYDNELRGLVAFASLAYEPDTDLDYIPDTDTMLVFGRNLLVVDAKNLRTRPNKALKLENGIIVNDGGKEVLKVKPSTHIWVNVLKQAGIQLDSIDGYVCIVSDTETKIIRNEEWYHSHTKLIHVSELLDILHEWVKGKDNTFYLDILTEIAKSQIREEKQLSIDIEAIKKQFGV